MLAAKLANLIILTGFKCSTWLSRRFNACSDRKKKIIVLTSGLLIAALLIAGCLTPLSCASGLSQNYHSAHIGLPSDLPKPDFLKPQLIDSLTKTNKSWMKN